MPKITIDNREVEVAPGRTVLDAARQLGLKIPTLCYRDGCKPNASCMTCVVKINGQKRYLPSCATVAEDGMRVESETDEVRAVRKAALELLLSDHTGECFAPCENVCPAHLDIPLMLQQLAGGRPLEGFLTVQQGLVLPAVLGYICPAPCQKGCRRGAIDEAIGIRAAHRFLAEQALDGQGGGASAGGNRPAAGKRVAIIGSGPAGLAAAYCLLQRGVACTIFDAREKPGGALRYSLTEEQLPRQVLDAEIAAIARLGAEFRMGTSLGPALPISKLQSDYDAILLATGEVQPQMVEAWGLSGGAQAIAVDKRTFATQTPGVFAAGGITGARRMAVRSVAEGKAAAAAILQYLAGRPLVGLPREFTLRCGDLKAAAAAQAEALGLLPPAAKAGKLDAAQARAEGARCLQCGCHRATECKLRLYTEEYGASTTRYQGQARQVRPTANQSRIHFDPRKCIACGICVQIACSAGVPARDRVGAPAGLTFSGRGFDVKLVVPFALSWAEGLGDAAEACVKACPTSALVLRETPVISKQ